MKLERAALNADAYYQGTGIPGNKHPIFTGDLLSSMITEVISELSLDLSVWERFI